MEYQALYRRWRPRGFSDVVGQAHVVTTLSNAIISKHIAHAYLFTGPRGTGKTSTAKILAKALNCENLQGAEPCDHCSSCQRINEGTFLDVLEIDGASNRGIDEIRDLREKIKFSPAEGRYKIYIIDEVHMLTMEAFNALLKTLEEPPQFVVFILATTEVHKLPLTILSRCQRFDFKRFTLSEIKGRLETILNAEEIPADGTALDLIAKYAEGGMRDALSLLEQCVAHSEKKLFETDVRAILGLIDNEEIDKLSTAIKEHNTKDALNILEAVCLDGKDLFQFGHSLIEYFRSLLLDLVTGVGNSSFTSGELIEMIQILATATNEVKKSFQKSLPLELALIKLTTNQINQTELVRRIEKIEQTLANLDLSHGALTQPLKKTVGVQEHIRVKPDISIPKEEKKAVNVKVSVPQGNSNFDWEAFLEAVKNKKRTVGALIQEGKVAEFDGAHLIVEFPPNLKFHIENLALPHNKELLENILLKMCGRVITISCIPQNANVKAEPTHLQDTPDVLEQAMSVFGGKIEPISKEE